MYKRRIAMAVAATVTAGLLSGCASEGEKFYSDWKRCALAGAVAGAAAGSTEDSEAAVTGAGVGAVVGGLFCALAFDEEAKAAPAPAPAAPVDGDDDGDGVPNSKDKCPGTPKGTPVDNSGCPLADKVTLKGVTFKHDSAELTPNAQTVLDDQVAIFKRHSNLKVEIQGHTDSSGTDAYNQKLSERRAASVVKYLTSKGVAASQLTSKGYGEKEPVASNKTKEGRAENRRVVMKTTAK